MSGTRRREIVLIVVWCVSLSVPAYVYSSGPGGCPNTGAEIITCPYAPPGLPTLCPQAAGCPGSKEVVNHGFWGTRYNPFTYRALAFGTYGDCTTIWTACIDIGGFVCDGDNNFVTHGGQYLVYTNVNCYY